MPEVVSEVSLRDLEVELQPTRAAARVDAPERVVGGATSARGARGSAVRAGPRSSPRRDGVSADPRDSESTSAHTSPEPSDSVVCPFKTAPVPEVDLPATLRVDSEPSPPSFALAMQPEPRHAPPSSAPASPAAQAAAALSSVPLTKRQRDIVAFFTQYVQTQGISPTLEEIADRFGVSKVTVFGHIEELERKGVIRRREKGASRALELVEDDPRRAGMPPSPAPQLAILGRIAAGAPIEELEDRETLDLGDLVPSGAEVFALRVCGDSMIEDAIADGDIVLVERRETARNGETVVAVLPEGDVTLKRFYREKGHVRLQPANAALHPILVDDVQIRGVVVGVIRRY